MAESSLPPPPPTNSNGLLIGFGVVVLLLVGGLVLWRVNASVAEPTNAASPASQALTPEAPSGEHAVPPPPPPPPPPAEGVAQESEQEVAAHSEQAQTEGVSVQNPSVPGKGTGPKPTSAQAGTPMANNDGCSGTCPNRADAALNQAVRQRGASAKNCYNAALRSNPTLQGKVAVKVRIGPNGSTCSASIASDTLGDPSVTSCITQKFKGGGYPKPQGGCADFEVPLSFVPSN